MLPLLTAAQMRLCDQHTIQTLGISSRTLMERAAQAAIEVMKRELTIDLKTRIFVLCGSGNNGGDGFAMARFLWEEGYTVTVCYGGAWNGSHPEIERMSDQCALQYDLWQTSGGRTKDNLPTLPSHSAVIVDALFGIGLDRPIVGKIAAWIEAVNESGLPVLAVDIPSGVCADTGALLGCAIRASVTATMAYPKRGLLLYPGAVHTGKVAVCNIGIGQDALLDENSSNTPTVYQITPEDLTPILDRPSYANKGTFGRVLIIGGMTGMSGAAYFAAKSAYRSGAGLVEILSTADNRIPLQTLIPEALFTAFAPTEQPNIQALAAILDRADSVVLGCGLGQSSEALALTEHVLRLCQKPLILDADALNLLAANQQLKTILTARSAPTVLTPHLGEAARLIGRPIPDIAESLFATADDIARQYHAICVLKDARTVVSDGSTRYIQNCGNSGMASGGSGDCLAGLVGSLVAQHRNCANLPTAYLAALAVLLHAMAGDCAAHCLGEHALMASDIASAIGDILHALVSSRNPQPLSLPPHFCIQNFLQNLKKSVDILKTS